MGKRYTKKTDEFRVSDSEGNVYKIIELTDYEEVTYMDGNKETFELLKSYQTPDGSHVNRIDEDNFDILCFNIKTNKDKIRVHKIKPREHRIWL